MARKLKTYQTSIGFFDLAVAAPSMKAALEIWGADSNLFHQGFAKETDDPAIVMATVAHPGVVLRRAVGTDGAFKKTSGLPKNLTSRKAASAPRNLVAPPTNAAKIDDAKARKAAEAFDKEQRKREEALRREEAVRTKERERRGALIATAEEALAAAEKEHGVRDAELKEELGAFERRAEQERQRWEQQRKKLVAALDRAKKVGD